ncbi:MAG: GHKL domain-containing protein [Phaeodactylibacter sp.]|nr:GHKL domain-containing protein [Phaeodactylibacter sp.]
MLKNFKIQILLNLLAILLIILLIGYAAARSELQVYLILLIPSALYFVWRLFRRVDKTNTEIATFLGNIKYDDYEANFPESKAAQDSYQTLHSAFNLVTEKFRDIRSEKEAQFQYLQAIVENVDTGLICFNSEGKTVLLNKALQQLLHKSYFPNFESIAKYNDNLHETLKTILPGERKLVKLIVKDRIVQLSVRKTILNLREDALHLYALQNIHSELEEQEVASWQKLIRILTHEIMNSISPVISLSETMKEWMHSPEGLSEESEEDVRKAIDAIHRRSSGLLHFTETYRQLTKIPPPQFQECDPVEIIERVLTLLQPDLDKRGIEIERNYKEKRYEAQLDPDLMEQVFINLIRNAMDALQNTTDPKIGIHLFKSLEGELEIQVADNGPGISTELLDEIFVPFFTTKKEGSGIGLSLSRQIVQLHKGNIYAYSKVGKGTIFTMKL